MRKLIAIIVCGLLAGLGVTPATAQTIDADNSAAVIFAYQRIGEDQFPETNIRRTQFEEQIKELVSGDYNVMALPDIVAALRANETLPPRTVALTFDGGHHSILETAAPILKDNNLPFTVFISTNHIDRKSREYMGWNDIKALLRNKMVTIGLHPASYTRLYNEPETEITRQINTARARFREELQTEATLFAYPFGEYSAAYRDIIEAQGFDAAVGQQSSVAYAGSDLYALPRFAMTESHGGLDRFRLTANALPIPVKDTEPRDPLLKTQTPSIGFTIDKALKDEIGNLTCFVSGQEKPVIEIVGETRAELRLDDNFNAARTRVNCTMPLAAGDDYEEPRWRWLGMLLISPPRQMHGEGATRQSALRSEPQE